MDDALQEFGLVLGPWVAAERVAARQGARWDVIGRMVVEGRESIARGRFGDGPVDEWCAHEDDVRREAIRLNDVRCPGEFCCLVPCPVVTGRWVTLEVFSSLGEAESFCDGYVASRDLS